MFEACMRLIWESFHNWIRQSDENNEVVYEALEKVSLLNDQEEINEKLFESSLLNCSNYLKNFTKYFVTPMVLCIDSG